MSVPSPCVDICQVDSNQICVGCFRSLEEIACWAQLNDTSKLDVLNSARHRKTSSARSNFCTTEEFGPESDEIMGT